MAERIIENLNKTVYPGIEEKILFKFTASPLSIEKLVRSSEGAIVGWSFEKPVPVEGGMLNMKDSVKTTIPDVYKVGQWSVSPAGLPTCILTAKLASDLIVKEDR
jgi:phytoene dehydrogenase-like protein